MQTFKVTLSRLVRQVVTFYVECDEAVDVSSVDTGVLANALYEYDAGTLDDLWKPDLCWTPEQGACSAVLCGQQTGVKALASLCRTGPRFKVRFTG